MIFHSFRRTRDDLSIARSMAPSWHRRDWRSLPTFQKPMVNGRLEMIPLHVVLPLRCPMTSRTARPGAGGFRSVLPGHGRNRREMGVGDLAVPKEMRRIGEAFYGRQAAYLGALESSDPEPLVEVLTRNVLEGGEGAKALAGYVRAAAWALAARDIKELRRGNLGFPDPASLNNRTDNGAVASKDSA